MFRELIFSIASGFVIYYLVKYIRHDIVRYYSLLFKFPCPKWTPVLGNIKELHCDETIFFKKIRRWNKEYGPTFILSVFYWTVLNVSGAEIVERVTSSMKHLRKGQLYCFMHSWLGSGLLTSTGAQWQTRRKILTPAFHFSILRDFVNVFNHHTDKLVDILKPKVGTEVNVIPLISQCTLDVIVETAMGCKLDLQKESDNNYVQAVHEVGKLAYFRLLRPWTLSSIIYWFYPQKQQEIALTKLINSFTNTIIRKREENFEKIEEPSAEEVDNAYTRKRKLVMLDLLLNAKVTNGMIDDEGIKDEVNTIMFRGHDTTAIAICFILMLLAYHRKVQDLVYEEIVQNSPENEKHLGWTALNDLKYMECVIKEGLRLYPSVPLIARTLDEDMKIKGDLTVPAGCDAYVHIFDVHRNSEYWPEPEKFDPDRFLPENCINRSPFVYIPFSVGPRNCIGQKFAMVELKAVLTGILKNFILEPIDTPETIILVPDIVLRVQNDRLLLRFVDRKRE